ncbi:hypothetical protein [Ideonella sp. YS5]|uniref:hypothetical protein n=1 Tax=Ideonella sp. YS5 TaxID=3453714 RepID=UPI003F6FF63B
MWPALATAAAWLCLALLTEPAAASQAVVHEARAAPAVIEAPMPSMPMASDCMPCAICCLAPTPTTQGFSGECRETEAPGWQLLAQPAPEVAEAFDSGRGHPRLPVCIVYCRWRD